VSEPAHEPEPIDQDDRPRTRRRLLLLVATGVVVVVGALAFAVFRPDTLVTNQRVDDSIPEEAPAASSPSGEDLVQADSDPNGTADQSAGLASGRFIGQDGHRATGRASVVRSAEGPLLVLQDLDVQNGPDLKVYLSPSAAGNVSGGVRVAPLKGNQGNQVYPLPAGTDLEGLDNVVIWCERFSTPFGTATLSN
jgi:hypothetical protein